MKTVRKFIEVIFCVCLITVFLPVLQVNAEETCKMYRLYNPNSGEHFYTSSEAERDSVYNAGWNIEGYGWISPSTSNTPVYRLYNPNAGDHHYTISIAERDQLVSVGWNYERIAWYACDSESGIPIYREYNPNAIAGAHNFTTNKTEHDQLISAGWKDEGIAFYAVGIGSKEGSKEHWYGYSDEKMIATRNVFGGQVDGKYNYADGGIMCSAFCISYARYAMFGDAREPATYWSKNGGAVWSWGAGTAHRGVDVLAVARQQIQQGKVVIIHTQNHYVVAYAYKGSGIDQSDFKVLNTYSYFGYPDGATPYLAYLSDFTLAGDGQIITF